MCAPRKCLGTLKPLGKPLSYRFVCCCCWYVILLKMVFPTVLLHEHNLSDLMEGSGWSRTVCNKVNLRNYGCLVIFFMTEKTALAVDREESNYALLTPKFLSWNIGHKGRIVSARFSSLQVWNPLLFSTCVVYRQMDHRHKLALFGGGIHRFDREQVSFFGFARHLPLLTVTNINGVLYGDFRSNAKFLRVPRKK